MVRVLTILAALLPLAARAAPRDPSPALERGLVVHCPFEPDERGSCEGVALRAAPDRQGRPGGAVQLDGVRSLARVRDGVQPARFTIAAWIRPDAIDRVQVIASKVRNLPGHWQRNFELRLDSGGRLFLHVPSGNGWEGVAGQRAIVPGRWVHVAATYDGARAQLYVDGVRDGAPFPAVYAASDADVVVGARPEGGGADGRTPSGPTFHFAGAMDDVRIYDRPLSDGEIADLRALPPVAAPPYAGGPPPYPGTPPAPPPMPGPGAGLLNVVARYPFDGSAEEESGRGLDGVVHGARPAEDRFGNPGGALAFAKRQRDYVDLGVWVEPEQLTVAAWVRPAVNDVIVFSKYSSARRPGDEWLELRVDSAGKLVFTLPVRSARDKVTSSRKIPVGKWTHVAATYDGEHAVLYVDGQVEGEAIVEPFDSFRGPAFAGARPEAAGKRPRLVSTFDGRMDDLVVLRGALAPPQVMALAGIDRGGPVRPGRGEAEDDRHDLVRIDKLVAQFDAACAGRNTSALAAVERSAIQEIEGELREQGSGRGRANDRPQRLRGALQEFQALRGRVDAVSLDRKRGILAELSEAAWVELAEELDDDAWTRSAPQNASWR